MLLTTHQLIRALGSANPDQPPVTEDRIRHAIRGGRVRRPNLVGRQFQWDDQAIKELAEAFGLKAPQPRHISGSVIGPRDLEFQYPAGPEYSDEDARAIGRGLGSRWREDSSQHRIDIVLEAAKDGAFREPRAAVFADLFLPEERRDDLGRSCFWDRIAGDYLYLTGRRPFLEGFLAAVLTQQSA